MGKQQDGLTEEQEDQLAEITDPAVMRLLRQILHRQEELESLLMGAFPGGDLEGHKRYHEEVILLMREKRQTWNDVRTHVIKGSVWALLLAMCGAVWTYAKEHLK